MKPWYLIMWFDQATMWFFRVFPGPFLVTFPLTSYYGLGHNIAGRVPIVSIAVLDWFSHERRDPVLGNTARPGSSTQGQPMILAHCW